jgi:hypothetical protein
MKVCIVTKHEKHKIITPLFSEAFNINPELLEFDTDTLGTFTPEKKRKLDIKHTLLAKAKIGLQDNKYMHSISSEGSFYPHPFLPGIHLNTELVCIVNHQNEYLIAEYTTPKIVFGKDQIHNLTELETFLKNYQFPSHQVIVQTKNWLGISKFHKQDFTEQELKNLLKKYKKFTIYTDQRANKNPTRQLAIQEACKLLIQKIQQENFFTNQQDS